MTLSGQDITIGYGLCHIPAISGKSVVRIPLFIPKADGDKLNFIHGKVPEFNSPTLLASSTSRGHI